MPIGRYIRHRLVTVLLLAVLTLALSLGALARLYTTNTTQRIERGREYVAAELSRLAMAGDRAAALLETPAGRVIGMFGGYLGPNDSPSAAPDEWREVLDRAIAAARAGQPAVAEATAGDGNVIAGAAVTTGGVTWVAYAVRPSTSLVTWRYIIGALSLVTVLLATAAVYLVAKLTRAEQAQATMAHNLAQNERLAALGRVAAGVAHEVRNPLAAIKLRLDLALGGAEPAESAIAAAGAEISRLDRLVADLLALTNKPLGARGRRSIGALARERAATLASWAAQRRVSLHVTGDASAPIDGDAMARAVDNLLRNAVEASADGGAVEVAVSQGGGAVRIAVVDGGPGVPTGVELFEPFFTTKPDGTGLGLAISRSIARAHAGDLAYGRVGETTRFELWVPA